MRGLVLLVVGVLAACAPVSPSGHVIYQQGRTVVQLETDPSVGRTGVKGNSHPATIKEAQLDAVLRAIGVRSEQGLVGTLLSLAVPADAVFTDAEVTMLAPVLAAGLSQAAPSQRVAFSHWSSQPGRRNSPLAGYVAVRDAYLRFGLNDHPTIGWQDPEDPSAPKLYELEFVRSGFLSPGTEEERKAGSKTRPLIQIDYRRYLAALDGQSSPASAGKEPPLVPAPATSRPAEVRPPTIPSPAAPRESAKSDAEVIKDLQQQVKDLAESNQALRAKLKQAQEGQEPSQSVIEELAKLRQELAETKQLLGDKVLELNRLENKSGTGRQR
jgi:hypothetical protein